MELHSITINIFYTFSDISSYKKMMRKKSKYVSLIVKWIEQIEQKRLDLIKFSWNFPPNTMELPLIYLSSESVGNGGENDDVFMM